MQANAKTIKNKPKVAWEEIPRMKLLSTEAWRFNFEGILKFSLLKNKNSTSELLGWLAVETITILSLTDRSQLKGLNITVYPESLRRADKNGAQ